MPRLQERRGVNSRVSRRQWTLDSGVRTENGNFGVRHGQPFRVNHRAGDGSGAALGKCGGGEAAEEKKDRQAYNRETHKNSSLVFHCRPHPQFLNLIP